MRKHIELNGYWDWSLPGGAVERRLVPSNYICIGTAEYSREIILDDFACKTVYLCFDGIHYCGKVSFNGIEVGNMLPYSPYRFNVTAWARKGKNTIKAIIDDITAHYGPTGGWEDYGGISRDVYIEVCDPVKVEDLQWTTAFSDDYRKAWCTLNVLIGNSHPGAVLCSLDVRLCYCGVLIHQETRSELMVEGTLKQCLEFSIDNPNLWTCDFPMLYNLNVSVSGNNCSDVVENRVGFREFKVAGSRFQLNGREIFLKGVARHEMWEGQGFTLTDEQIEQDLLLIKKMGANFVRLVHYPHSRRTIETADRLGLMVSEEPGLWWSDMSNSDITDKALEIMRRIVLRDRNSPSVVAWLFFNECMLENAGRYLKDGARMCRSLDPTRLVAGANCMDSEEAKLVFDECGFDFYTQHPYSYEPDALVKAMNVLQGKPLVFTEWGGWLIHNNPNLLQWFKRVISKHAHSSAPEPSLAGMCWWQWQDIREYMRGLPGCMDGVLSDGLVDASRNRKPMYSVMAEFFDLIDRPWDPGYRIEHIGIHLDTGDQTTRYTPVSLPNRSSWNQPAAWETMLDNVKRFERTRQRKSGRNMGPVMPQHIEAAAGLPVDIPEGRPLVLAGDCTSIEISLNVNASALHFIGHATWFDGYPLRGNQGDVLARYILFYDDGSRAEIPLRNGFELASSSMHALHTRLNPIALNAPRILKLTIDADWEVYQVNHFVLKTDRTKRLNKLLFESLNQDFYPLLYGITAELSKG